MGGLSVLLLRALLKKMGGHCLFCELCYLQAGSGAGVGSELASDVQLLGRSTIGPHSPGQSSPLQGLGLRPCVSAQAWSCVTPRTA